MSLRLVSMLALALGGSALLPGSSGSGERQASSNASAGAQQVAPPSQPAGASPIAAGTAPAGSASPTQATSPENAAGTGDSSDETEGGGSSSFQPAATAPTLCDPRFAALTPLTWRAINSREEAQVQLYRADGSVDPDAVHRLAHLLRDLGTGEDSPVVTRTLQLLVRIATRFSASRIEVISGYRSGRHSNGRVFRREGYHGVGSAIDFRMPGADLQHIAAYARTFAHVGVGYYPHDGFVHLDSRDQTFFWENAARRHHRGWNRPLDRSGVAARDIAWTAQADLPWDRPEDAVTLVLSPRTHPGSHRPRSRHAHHGSHASHSSHHEHHRSSGRHHRQARSSRQRVLHVFSGGVTPH